jgi:hypothetical protein
MKEDYMKRSAIFLAIVAAVGLTFYLGYERFSVLQIFHRRPTITVQISQKGVGPDCTVYTGDIAHPKDSTVRLPAFLSRPDHIRWCIANSASTQYFIHFPGNPTPLDLPLSQNDFLVNKNPDPPNICSDVLSPVGKRDVEYDYGVRYTTASGSACSDPKVILK